MNFNVIVSATKSVNSIRRFVEDGQLYLMLQELGTVELEAARMALRYATNARDANSEVRLAVGHLQSAHIAFSRLSSDRGWKYMFQPDDYEIACARDIYCCSLLAICYRYLQEDHSAREALQMAKEAHGKYWVEDDMYSFSIITATMNPFYFPKRLKRVLKGEMLYPPSKAEFKELCDLMEK